LRLDATYSLSSCWSEEVSPIASRIFPFLIPHFYHGYYVSSDSVISADIIKSDPAPQPRFELGTTDSESAVLPITPKGKSVSREGGISIRIRLYCLGTPYALEYNRPATERIFKERRAGIEPAPKAWKALVLPLNYRRNNVDKCWESGANLMAI
jgi:hypothetical protein